MKLYFVALVLFIIHFAFGCGTNLFESAVKQDSAELAARKLEDNKADEAIDICDKGLESDPDNDRLKALKAAALYQKYAIDVFKVVESLGGNTSGGTGNQSVMSKLISAMPTPTLDTLAASALALNLINSIPQDKRRASDDFQQSLYLMIDTSLRTKYYDKNGDGVLTADELLDLTSDDAITILSNIAGAGTILSSITGSGIDASKSGEAVKKIQEEINAESGSTNEEKLKSYLAKKTAK